MEITIIKDEKNLLEVQINSVTVAEILRVYLNEAGVEMAAWRREHPTEAPILRVESKNPRKDIKTAVEKISKEIDGYSDEFKKLK